MNQYKAIGWVRDKQGNVIRYKVKDVCNCITQFSDGTGYKDPETGMANTAPYILVTSDTGEQRIRRLTPREVYRLMGVPETAIDRLLSWCKKSEIQTHDWPLLFSREEWNPAITNDYDVPAIPPQDHYKLAGNSIVVDVLAAIYRQLLPRREVSLVTLCSGYDSQMLALQQTGPGRLVAWSEFDPESAKPLRQQPAVVAHNLLFPESEGLNVGDMTRADWDAMGGGTEVDLLTYSTPCQDISKAGRQAGLTEGSGTRSAVLWHTERAIRALRPRWLIQENVASLVSRKMQPHFQRWLDLLQSLGYRSEWRVLNARDYGVPQNRERVFCVSIREDVGSDFSWPGKLPLTRTVADIVEPDVDESYYLPPESVTAFLKRL